MRNLVTALALATIAFAAAPALADDSQCTTAPQSEWMTIDAITAKFVADGYQVRQVKIEDSCYEIYAKDKAGNRVETYVDPVSGDVVKTKIDD
ncbi:MAG: PepSY domain-containing protein [Rhizobiaceae bacterium]|nr:PepSY domain-containing protein [Rhizobiaceae bacterium]